jgi:hypothetical protein
MLVAMPSLPAAALLEEHIASLRNVTEARRSLEAFRPWIGSPSDRPTVAGVRLRTTDDREAAIVDSAYERIRHRAYDLWQAAGEPEGRSDEFWWIAVRELSEKGVAETRAMPSGELPSDLAVEPKASERGAEGEAAPRQRRVAAERDVAPRKTG